MSEPLLQAAKRAARLLAMHRVQCEANKSGRVSRSTLWGSANLVDLLAGIENATGEPQQVSDWLEDRRAILLQPQD